MLSKYGNLIAHLKTSVFQFRVKNSRCLFQLPKKNRIVKVKHSGTKAKDNCEGITKSCRNFTVKKNRSLI